MLLLVFELLDISLIPLQRKYKTEAPIRSDGALWIITTMNNLCVVVTDFFSVSFCFCVFIFHLMPIVDLVCFLGVSSVILDEVNSKCKASGSLIVLI